MGTKPPLYAKLLHLWRTDSARLQAWYTGILAILVFSAACYAFSTPLSRLSNLVFDEYQQIKPRPGFQAPITIIDIDEEAIAQNGQWPWPRSVMADLVDRLGNLGAATIAFDMTFSEKDRTSPEKTIQNLKEMGAAIEFPAGAPELDNDKIFAQSIARNPVVLGIAFSNEGNSAYPTPKAAFGWGGHDPKSFLSRYKAALVNLPELHDGAGGLGFFSFPPLEDGIVRKVPLVKSAGGKLYPSLSMEALRTAQGAGVFKIRTTSGTKEVDTGNPGIVLIQAGDFEIPTEADGQVWIYYSKDMTNRTLSASKILGSTASEQELQDRIEGHIVLVGTSAIGLKDFVTTPLAANVPGVFVHGEVIDQIISGTYLSRPDWMVGAEYSLGLILSLILILFLRPNRPAITFTMTIALIVATGALSWYLFDKYRWLMSPIVPAIAVGFVYITVTLSQYLNNVREKRFVRGAFGRYLAPTLVDQLSDNPDTLKLGGEIRDLTLLFCDIRGFTSLSEGLDPQELTKLLNGFLTPMTDELLSSGATIDKYMGDAIMAFWNAPLPIKNHNYLACKAALSMLDRLEIHNETTERPIRIGVGLNTGDCCVGNLGSEQRFSYSAIGDSVNVASRIEGLTKQYGLSLLVSETVLESPDFASDQNMEIIEVDRVRVVGRSTPLTLFTIFKPDDDEAPDGFDYKSVHADFLAAYRAMDFDEAERLVLTLWSKAPAPLEQFYDIYLGRIATLRSSPPAEGWDGVYTFDSK
ncbi:MAG: adenylate/guanylate cyclase domain-containing protein [Stappiaceae bacterium]